MNNEIKVFGSEIEAGLESLIRSSTSIAYCSPTILPESPGEDLGKMLEFPFATAAQDDDDIYHVYSILVTTSWNKNDDVFDKDEVWASKNTPKYKPTNIEHDERQIVGGIIDNWAVDDKFKLIDEKVGLEGLPDHYHILVASVVYKQWQDPAYKQRAMDLIQSIEQGDKYVSMECLFHGFDYAVVGPDGESHILSRNEETAFLTNHLRAYGGTGAYQDHQVGRLLRNITFSGKGFVNKPANPESVIFDKHKVFEFNTASTSSKNTLFPEYGVSINDINTTFNDQEESHDMSNEIINDQLKELKEALAVAKAENEQLIDKLSVANVEKYEATISELQEAAKTHAEELSQSADELKEAQKSLVEAVTALSEQEQALDFANNAISEMKAIEAIRNRTAMLLEAGISAEDAEAKVETFASLDDEQFEALVATFVDYNNQFQVSEVSEVAESVDEATEVVEEAETTEAGESDEDEAEEAKADEAVLETAEAEEAVAISVEADPADGTEEADTVRAGLQDWVTKCILNSESGE